MEKNFEVVAYHDLFLDEVIFLGSFEDCKDFYDEYVRETKGECDLEIRPREDVEKVQLTVNLFELKNFNWIEPSTCDICHKLSAIAAYLSIKGIESYEICPDCLVQIRRYCKMMNERFDFSIGDHYNSAWIAGLTDSELADEINALDCYDGDLMRDLCYRANLLDEYCEADSDTVMGICYKAAKILGVEID